MTGQQTSSQIKVWSFEFDASDPEVNFTDGIYNTSIVLKNNSIIIGAGIQPFQDWTLLPIVLGGLTLLIECPSLNEPGGIFSIDNIVLPSSTGVYAPNLWSMSTYFNSVNTAAVPPTTYPLSNPMTLVNPNNDFINIRLRGWTGSGVTAFSFQYYVQVIEFDF